VEVTCVTQNKLIRFITDMVQKVFDKAIFQRCLIYDKLGSFVGSKKSVTFRLKHRSSVFSAVHMPLLTFYVVQHLQLQQRVRQLIFSLSNYKYSQTLKKTNFTNKMNVF
jgi:hypothetical protein